MSKKEVKKQHYVPQFYLNYFADNNKNIYVYDKATLKQFTSNSKGVASQQFFYDLFDNDNQFIEKNHNRIYENAFSSFMPQFFKEIEKHKYFSLKRYHKEEIASFVAYQYIRTKKFREESYRLNTGVHIYAPVDSKLLEDLHPTLVHRFLLVDYHLHNTLFNKLLNEYVWIIGRNTSNQLFYTSDHPLAQTKTIQQLHDEQRIKKGSSFTLLSEQIAFPIAPKYIILFFKKNKFKRFNRKKNRILNLDNEEIKRLNYMQVMGCYRQVYSQNNDFSFAEEIEELLRQAQIASGKDPNTILVPPQKKEIKNKEEGL
ncbi:DUF4238 domain-containing protein [Bacillus velezensis]|nr:DUF4238 domain-containing protein [Bacillus velezensis]